MFIEINIFERNLKIGVVDIKWNVGINIFCVLYNVLVIFFLIVNKYLLEIV